MTYFFHTTFLRPLHTSMTLFFYPHKQQDLDGDGIPDYLDADDDGDGIPDVDDDDPYPDFIAEVSLL